MFTIEKTKEPGQTPTILLSTMDKQKAEERFSKEKKKHKKGTLALKKDGTRIDAIVLS